ncbi:hypothetical protein JY427_02160 [Stenotrophomonas maltophilia]|nr:hypothetical protein [Stenotrophomonas maltophilia]
MVETVLGMTDLQIKLFTAIGQILVAAAVGSIAWRQWRTAQQQAETARKKLVLDLFDRRIGLYEHLEELLGELERGKNPNLTFLQVHQLTAKMRWVFGPAIVRRLSRDVVPVFRQYLDADQAVRRTTDPEASLEARQRLIEAFEKVGDAWAMLPEIFANSLTLRD